MRLLACLSTGALALCGACSFDNPLYVSPTSESDGPGTSSSSGGEETGDITPTTAGPTGTGTTTPTTDSSESSDSDDSDDSSDSDSDTGMPAAYCGDGAINPGEECDDGNDVDGDACTNLCLWALCGDGILWPADEACDDGNSVEDDGCTNLCAFPACGDGVLNQDSEECDNGELNADNTECTKSCKYNVCGDGHLGPEEECDDGNLQDGDGCSAACVLELCGDGVKNGDEACDDMNNVEDDMCTSLCVPPPELIKLNPAGTSAVLGQPIGEELPSPCGDGALVGLVVVFDPMYVAQVGPICADYDLEHVAGGIFRMVQVGPHYVPDDLLGDAPDGALELEVACLDDASFIVGMGGWGKQEGISEIGIQCAALTVKPDDKSYTVSVEAPDTYKIGMPVGELLPLVTCAMGSFATGIIGVVNPPSMSGLRLGCSKPVFNTW